MSQYLLDGLRQAVGVKNVRPGDSLSEDEVQSYCLDWRKRRRGKPLALVFPADTKEVAMVVKACALAGVAVVPQGGNTGLVLGSSVDESGTQVLLSLRRLNKILGVDTANLSITVQAGVLLQAVQEAAAQEGLLFPLSLAAQGSCTIGGNLATNAGGTQVLRYGTMRDLCLGLEVVSAQGEIWHGLSALRKDNTGYDLRHLFIGSEGTLGVITAATLKLFPAPRAKVTALVAVSQAEDVVRILNHAQSELGASLTAFEVMGNFALSLVAKHFPHLAFPAFSKASTWYALLECSDEWTQERAKQNLIRVLEAQLEAGGIEDATLAQSEAQSRALWAIRESIPLAQNQEGLNVKHDISLPISSIPKFVEQTDSILAAKFAGVRFVNFGHWGDGNLHYNVQCPDGADAAQFLRLNESAINAIIYEQVLQYHGSISAEHGIGALKRDVLSQTKSSVAMSMMRSIKRALDPYNILNPGKVL